MLWCGLYSKSVVFNRGYSKIFQEVYKIFLFFNENCNVLPLIIYSYRVSTVDVPESPIATDTRGQWQQQSCDTMHWNEEWWGSVPLSVVVFILSPCDYDLFAKVNEPLRGTRYNTRDELTHTTGYRARVVIRLVFPAHVLFFRVKNSVWADFLNLTKCPGFWTNYHLSLFLINSMLSWHFWWFFFTVTSSLVFSQCL